MIDTSTLQGGWFIAMGAREFRSGLVSEIDQIDWDNLLELRAFTPEHEIKWVHGQVRDSADIQYDWTPEEKKDYDEHYLDIDSTKTAIKNGFAEVWATGGGKYHLPLSEKNLPPEKLAIQVYYRADDKGFLQPFDFRIAGFIWKEDE